MEANTKTAEAQARAEQKKEQTNTDTQKLSKKVKRSERSVKSYQFFLLRVLIFIIVVWVLFFKVVGLTHMPNGDMYPRLDAGDLVLFYRLEKNFKAQDVVVFETATPDTQEKQLFICRVVAVAGDTVQITDSERLVINGNTMIEPNIFYSTPRYEGFTEYPLTLQPGEVFVLADSRAGGNDSRYFGPIKTDAILGTVITIVRRTNL